MPQPPRGSAALIVVILLAGIAIAAANLAVALLSAKGAVDLPALAELSQACLPCVIYLAATPVVAALLVSLLASRRPAASTASVPSPAATDRETAEPKVPSSAPALRLLALLQHEGRLVDFLGENIESYDDAQIGAAVRSIHAGCRKALRERIELERVLDAEDGSEVVVEPGFDPAAIRLTGNVAGAPPFRGTLQHGGWRATKVSLPQSPGGVDPTIIEPAEVEIP